MTERRCDILVAGGGVGGCAAALAASSMGLKVVMTEETDWIGGQLTSQAVPSDEHPWIEQFGCTRRYRSYRDNIRRYYRDNYPLLPASRGDPHLNPGDGQVSRICHEPRVGVAVLEEMLACQRAAGRLDVLLGHRPVSAAVGGDRVNAVTVVNLGTGGTETIGADYVLDATELGDLLALTRTEYVSGAESRAATGEPHAVGGRTEPDNVQSFTWCFPVAFDPDGNRVIDRPEQYDRWRDYIPPLDPPWSGRLLDWTHTHPVSLKPYRRVLFPGESGDQWAPLWPYRRIVASHHYPAGFMPHEVTLVNWPQNDYWEGNIIDKPAAEVEKHLAAAKQLSLSLMYWLQTEAPRPDGGRGYPGLYLRPDLTGTADGLAKAVYVRESRRIHAVFTVTENHVGASARGGLSAEEFPDSIGIGSYRIDLHPTCGGTNYIDISSLPFQIPLGALIPVRMENLIPACKNLGTTHVTNGCYRLHPVEWNIGEAAGLLASFCLGRKAKPRAVREKKDLLEEFQKILTAEGIELKWPRLTPR